MNLMPVDSLMVHEKEICGQFASTIVNDRHPNSLTPYYNKMAEAMRSSKETKRANISIDSIEEFQRI